LNIVSQTHKAICEDRSGEQSRRVENDQKKSSGKDIGISCPVLQQHVTADRAEQLEFMLNTRECTDAIRAETTVPGQKPSSGRDQSPKKLTHIFRMNFEKKFCTIEPTPGPFQI
jgi:hypothetical protein